MRDQWLEVALHFEGGEGETAEAAAQVLAELSQGRVVWSYEHPQVEARGRVKARGPLTVRAYLPVTPETLEAVRRRVAEALWHLHVIRPLPEPRFRVLRDEDWLHAWKRFYRPLRVGRRFLVVPAWMTPPPGEDRVPIFIEPGMAFGTGMHPSTRLCLEALEEAVHPGRPMFDVGCGSGILTIAAAKLGARPAVGVDVEPEAVEEARANALRNQVAEATVFLPGSLDQLLAGKAPVTRAPVVVANIFADVLADLLNRGLAHLLTPDGLLVLSGILEDKTDLVEEAAARQGLVLHRRTQEGEWVCLHYKLSTSSP